MIFQTRRLLICFAALFALVATGTALTRPQYVRLKGKGRKKIGGPYNRVFEALLYDRGSVFCLVGAALMAISIYTMGEVVVAPTNDFLLGFWGS